MFQLRLKFEETYISMLKLHPLFSDHMVLQKGIDIIISGIGDPGSLIVISFAEVSISSCVDGKGRWSVELGKFDYGGPYCLQLSDSHDTINIKDIYVGEVWLCSGQSNMDQRVSSCGLEWCGVDNEAEEVAGANYPLIRCYSVRLQLSKSLCEFPADKNTQYYDPKAPPYHGEWQVCSPAMVGTFSAISYFFARELHLKLGVPVGIVVSCYGASTAQAWIGREVLLGNEKINFLFNEYAVACYEYKTGICINKYKQLLSDWERAEKDRKQKGIELPRHLRRRPSYPRDPNLDQHSPSILYNGMIAPLVPYAFCGVIWWQGESNQPTAEIYLNLMEALIGNWRNLFHSNLTFLIIQQPNVNEPAGTPIGRERLAKIREAQMLASSLHNVGLVVTIDIGGINVHSSNKQEVGRRTALCARGIHYKASVGFSGPIYDRMISDGDGNIRLYFKWNEGLYFSDNRKTFALASDAGQFEWVTAEIVNDCIVICSSGIKGTPIIRYGWSDNPPINLYNKYGLPASPFRTDVK